MGAKSSKEAASTDTFEKALAEFETRLRRCHVTLIELKTNENRWLNRITFYGLSVWIVLIAVVFTYQVPFYFLFTSFINFRIFNVTLLDEYPGLSLKTGIMPPESFLQNLLRFIVVMFSPFLIYKLRALISWYFSKKRAQIEDDIETLKQKQKDKLEELKTITEFYRAKQLIERYETLITKDTIEPDPVSNSQPPLPPSIPSPYVNGTASSSLPESLTNTSNTSLEFTDPNRPSTSGWFNKLLDRIVVGNDAPYTQYALICSQCYHHNGLALPDDFFKIKYRCRNCHTLNGQGNLPSSPSALNPLAFSNSPSFDTLAPVSPLSQTSSIILPQSSLISLPSTTATSEATSITKNSNLSSSDVLSLNSRKEIEKETIIKDSSKKKDPPSPSDSIKPEIKLNGDKKNVNLDSTEK